MTPILEPEAPIEPEESTKSTKNCFKATFGEIHNYEYLIVVVLPYRVPDNICHYAAREATMVVDQFLKPDFEYQVSKNNAYEQEEFRKLDVFFGSIIY